MARASIRCVVGVVCGLGIGLAVASLVPARAQESAQAGQIPSYEFYEFGVVPRPAITQALLLSPSIQRELKLTEDQKKELSRNRETRMLRFLAARREKKNPAEFRKARNAIFQETAAAEMAILTPDQRRRLDQIQLQAQGPFAFARGDDEGNDAALARAQFVGPPMAKRLGLSGDQAKQLRHLAEEGTARIEEASRFPIPWTSREKPSPEEIRKLIATPEFRSAKAKARQATRAAWDAAIARIEEILTPEQLASYRAFLGQPYDFARLGSRPGLPEANMDALAVARAFRTGGGGQQADPNFDASVARPAFTAWHPRVAVDEAHNNFHTATGRYKPFADLMTHDGCLVSRNTGKLDAEALGRCDILLIANAMVAGRGTNDQHPDSAFSEEECEAVQRWVWAGGSLLLITDHEPFGSASKALALRFNVAMNNAGTTDPANTDEKTGGLVYSRENGLILDHPITLGRDPSEQIDRVETFFGQAIYGPVGSTPFLRFADSATSEGENGERSAAGWAQGLAMNYGAGRVVVMGEAGELSAQLGGGDPFGMNVPGIDNKQMALNMVRWLAGALEPAPVAVAAPPEVYRVRRFRPFRRGRIRIAVDR